MNRRAIIKADLLFILSGSAKRITGTYFLPLFFCYLPLLINNDLKKKPHQAV
jgi:hypothetical protein